MSTLNKHLTLCLIAITTLMASPSYAQLPSLTFLETNRSVGFDRGQRQGFTGGPFITFSNNEVLDDGIGTFDESIAAPSFDNGDPFSPVFAPAIDPIATQSTTVSFNSVSGTGSIDGRIISDPGGIREIRDQGSSALSILFDLSGPTEFMFDSSVSGDVGVFLFSQTDDGFDSDIIGGSSEFELGNTEDSQTGVLDAGQYRLAVTPSFFVTESQTGTFDFSFEANVVPEPSTLPILSTVALVGLTRRRRR